MMSPRLSSLVPWAITGLAVLALAAPWFQLYTSQLSLGNVHQVDRNTVLNKNIVDIAAFTSLGIIIVGLLVRIRSRTVPFLIQEIVAIIRTPPKGYAANGGTRENHVKGVLGTLFTVLIGRVLLLGKMGVCEDFQQWMSHFLIMWGFIGLAVTTTIDAIVNSSAVPLPLLHPIRILGNLTGVIFMAGLTLAIARRALLPQARTTSRLGDWVFLLSLYSTGATGFAVQWFATTANSIGTSLSYLAHLVFIALLLTSAPWSKFIHALWRPSWIVYTTLALKEGK